MDSVSEHARILQKNDNVHSIRHNVLLYHTHHVSLASIINF